MTGPCGLWRRMVALWTCLWGLWLALPPLVLADVANEVLREMRPGTGIEPEPTDPWGLLSAFLVVLGVVMVAAGVGAVLALRMRQRGESFSGRNYAMEAEALAEVERLEKRVREGRCDATRFASELSDTLRGFLEKALHLAATRQTTPEFLDGLRNSMQLRPEHQELLREFLEQCDLAKFAGVSPGPQQISRLSQAARDLIRAVSGRDIAP